MPKDIKLKWQNIALAALAAVGMLLVMSCGLVKNLTGGTAGKVSGPNPAGNQNLTPANQKPQRTPNPSTSSPPTPGFEKFALLETGKFHQTQAFSVFDKRVGYIKNIDFNYAYSDGRFDQVQSYKTDVHLTIYEFASAQTARAFHQKSIEATIPATEADKVKLPRCAGEKSDSDGFVGPDKLVKRLSHPNGSEIAVIHSGDFNMWDCKRGSNRTEYVSWTDGPYYFSASALPYSKVKDGEPGSTGFGRAEEFVVDYLKTLGQAIVP
jgi:hypothetical protein